MNRFSYSKQAETLRIFFGIPQARIDRDVGSALLDIERICQEIDAYHAVAREERTAEQMAWQYHNEFLQAHCMRKSPQIDEAEAFFWLVFAAEDVVEDAAMSASEKGETGELIRRMEEIERREGLKVNDYWLIGEGPADYQAASAASDILLGRIDEAVMASVLRRYRFAAAVEMYERNRMEFDVMREVGRRMVFARKQSEGDGGDSEDSGLLRKYGRAGVDLLHRRLGERKRKPGAPGRR